MAGHLLDALIGFVVAFSLTVLRPTLRFGSTSGGTRSRRLGVRRQWSGAEMARQDPPRSVQQAARDTSVNLGPALGSGLYGLLLDEVTHGSSLVLCAVAAALVAAAGFLRLVKT